MYIDSWYTIGPFPNPDRMNIDKRFPPESVRGGRVDLDARYVCKGGRELRWQYVQSPSVKITPPQVGAQGRWYAWTVVYADTECDRWVVFGCGDYGFVWFRKGGTIYFSGKTPRTLTHRRGWRKVRFRRGVNSVNPTTLPSVRPEGPEGFSRGRKPPV